MSERIGRGKFWLGTLGLVILLLAMLVVFTATYMAPANAWRGGPLALMLLMIPFGLLHTWLLVLRLHDFGRTGWWALLIGPMLTLLPWAMMNESLAVYQRIEQSYEAQQAIKGYVIALETGAFALFFGGWIVMGLARGTVGPNRFGPDPVDRA